MKQYVVISSLLLVAAGVSTTSCVSKKKYLDAQIALRQSKNDSAQLAYNLQQQRAEAEALKKDKANLLSDKANLAADIAALEARKKQLQQSLDAASADASSKGKALAEREQQIAEQQRKLQQLQSLIEEQKRASDALRNKMADALKGFAASDLTVTQKNGKVYVSLSENLLFPSGSATVNMQGKAALQKLAEVLNANTDIAVNIEGHTDSIPIRGGRFEDNWGLSVARATSIVRILVNDYAVDPKRVIASGHSEFDPVDSNLSKEGRARNRRTEIILTPRLAELYQLINAQ